MAVHALYMTTKYVVINVFCQLQCRIFLQMCYDNSSGVLYILGGRVVSMDICSGLYAYHTVDKQWICLAPDQSGDVSVKPVFPRSGHVTVFHPVREGQWLVCSFVIYFFAGNAPALCNRWSEAAGSTKVNISLRS